MGGRWNPWLLQFSELSVLSGGKWSLLSDVDPPMLDGCLTAFPILLQLQLKHCQTVRRARHSHGELLPARDTPSGVLSLDDGVTSSQRDG